MELPEQELEVKLPGADSLGHSAMLVGQRQPNLDDAARVDVLLDDVVLVLLSGC